MSNYTYRNPLDKGYKQFKLTKQQHNKLFKYRHMKWYDKYEYYYNDTCVIMHNFLNWKAIIFNTIMFPVTVLFEGLGNIKEILHEYKRLYNQKKHGNFSIDNFNNKSETYKEIMEIKHDI